MLALLSPAKKLDDSPVAVDITTTEPQLMGHTRELMATTRALGVDDLKSLMKLSDNLATLNHERFQAWVPEHDASNSLPAALYFAGDVYQGLDARSLDAGALGWAQEHVAILSGLYGLLRPLDRIQPYRLEMGTSLTTERGGSLYAFWDDTLARRIDALVEGHADPTIVNLASNEYSKAVKRSALQHRIVDFVFQDVKDGKARTLSFYAKRARGSMARWIIEHRLDRLDDLKHATPDDYAYDAEASTPDKWVYRRPQPPPKGR